MAGIDYGAIVLKNGKRYKGDNLYPSIDELGIVFYKCCVGSIRNDKDYYWFRGEKFVEKIVFNGISIRVKTLIKYNVYTAEIFHRGDRYNIIFGYGIDNDINIWNRVKTIYLGKTGSRKVDNWLRRRGLN